MLKTRIILTFPKAQATLTVYWFALKFALLIPIVDMHLKLFGYNRTLALLKKFIPANSTPTPLLNNQPASASIIRSIVRQVRDHSPLAGTCLSRSLVLWLQLRRMGINTELYIGTRTESKKFEAHAWVEYQGQPLNAGKHVRRRYIAFEESMV